MPHEQPQQLEFRCGQRQGLSSESRRLRRPINHQRTSPKLFVGGARQPSAQDRLMFIDGVPADSVSGDWIEVRNPATMELVGRVPAGTERDVDRAVSAARAAFRDGRWQRVGGTRLTTPGGFLRRVVSVGRGSRLRIWSPRDRRYSGILTIM